MEAMIEGQQVKHSQYGFGVVTESDEERTTIEFDAHGVKKFVTSMMTAELVGDGPIKPRSKRRKKAVRAKSAA